MKKLLMICCVALASVTVASAQMTWGIKGGANYANYDITLKGASLSLQPGYKLGFYVGGVNNFQFGNSDWGLQTELLYNYTGIRLGMKQDFAQTILDPAMSSLITGNLALSANFHQILLPIMAKYQATEGLSIMAGPYFSYTVANNVRGNNAVEDLYNSTLGNMSQISFDDFRKDVAKDLVSDNIRKFDLGITLGIEYKLCYGFFVDAKYSFGLMNLLKSDLEIKDPLLSMIQDMQVAQGNTPIAGETPWEDLIGAKPRMKYSSFQLGVGYRF